MSHPPVDPTAAPPAMHRRPSQAQARLDAINQRTSPSRLRAAQQRAATMPQGGGTRSAEEAAAMMLLPHALAPSSPPPQLSLLQLHHQRLAAEREAALRARMRAQMAPEVDDPAAQPGSNHSRCVCSPGAAYCTCGAAAPASSSAAAAASSHDAVASPAPSAASPSSSASASSSASSVLHRGAAWARSASKLRSTILSAYACWKWIAGEDSPAHHSATGAAAALDAAVSPSVSAAAANGMRSAASSASLRGMAHRSFISQSASPLSLKTLLPLLRRYIRTLIFLARFYSRSFHRFLRPHLLLLLRSRALSRLVSLAFPFLRRHLFLLAHALFVWSSAIIIVKRYLPPAVGEAAAAQAGIVGGIAASVRGQFTSALARWGSWSAFRRLVYSASAAGSLFLLYTCFQIVREHVRRRRKALEERVARRALETAAVLESQGGSSWSAEELAAFAAVSLAHASDSPYVSPEPSPDPTPTMSPSTSQADLSWLEVASRYPEDEMEWRQQQQQQQQAHAPAAAGEAAVSGEDDAHHSHATTAAAAASASAASSASPSPPPALFVTPPRASAFAPVASSSAAVTPRSAAMSLHPLASSLSSRMEWSPAGERDRASAGHASAASYDASAVAAPASAAMPVSSVSSSSFSPSHPAVPAAAVLLPPGAPLPALALSSSSSLSFISPASHRLTQIRIEQHARNPAAARAMRVQAMRILDNVEPNSVPLPAAAPLAASPSPPPPAAAATGFLPSLRNLFR